MHFHGSVEQPPSTWAADRTAAAADMSDFQGSGSVEHHVTNQPRIWSENDPNTATSAGGFHGGGTVDERIRIEAHAWLQHAAPVDMETTGAEAVNAEAAEAASAAAREQRLAFDFMNSMGSLGLQESGVTASTVGRGWSLHVTEDGQFFAHNALTGHSTWQAPPAQHCL